MPNDERTHNVPNQQPELRAGGRDRSSTDSISARTLTIALFVALGVLVVLLVLLIR
ncbi:MAG: hypothetical protein ACJ76A_11375 [Actinomycetota bacterium]|jgi:hypothetical protein